MILSGYRDIKKLAEGPVRVFYSALREDGTPVILKALKSEHPSTDSIALMYHEFEVTKDLKFPGILQVYDLIDQENQYALVQEDIHGISLSKYLQKFPVKNLSMFLKLAIQMVKIVGELHQHFIIHKDIKASNFIIQPETGLEKLTDLNFSSKLLHEVQDIVPPEKLEGSLGYMAPEQTGRMNMNIDYRSDFYALGVTFYEMLSGELPFIYSDPLELIHAHLANPIPEAHSREFEVPLVLVKIIQKLMAKNPRERYQSAIGLQFDLERCQKEFDKTGKIELFPLGEQEVFDHLNLSQKLYGREKESKVLLESYSRASQGEVEALMICGYSGIGKTMLINEVHKPMVQHKGYFISGKFDQLQRNTPYTAITQAFNQFAHQILAESESRFEKMKKNILQAVGDLGQIIVELAPDIELLIGKQAPLEKLPAQETQNRMMTYFGRFMGAISSKDHPLVIFIDDLQWIDSGSLLLLEALLTNPKLSHILFIGAYRDNEVDENHPLRTYLKHIESKGRNIQFLRLGPLQEKDYESLFEDSFHRNKESISTLSELIYKRTNGNPFFCKQVISSLYKEELLFFDYEKKQWNWELDKILALKITDNVIDLMLNKLDELPGETKYILQYAACIGNRFSLNILALITEKSSGEIGRLLWPALDSELVLSFKLGYKRAEALVKEDLASALAKEITYQFIHDKVQQAVYESMSLSEKQNTHLKIARLLLEKETDVSQKEHLFTVTDHFNQTHPLLKLEERIKVAELNYRAGIEARNANAYQPMFNYLEAALDLMDDTWWKNHYDLIFQVSRDRAMALYLLNDLDRSRIETEKLFPLCKANLDKASLYRIILLIYYRKSDFENAINTVCTALGLLGVELAPTIAKPRLLFKLLLLKFRMRKSRLNKLDTELKSLQNPSIEMAFEIMLESFFLFFEKGTESFVYLTVTAMNVLLKYGMPNSASFWLMAYGLVELNLFSRGDLSVRLWNFSQKFFERNPHKYSQCQAYTWAGMFITPLYFTFELAMKERDFAIQLARESGNIFMESIAVAVGTFIAMSEGDSLEKPMKIAKQASDLCMERGMAHHAYNFEVYYLLFKNLIEEKLDSEERLQELEDLILQSKSLQIITTTLKYKSFYYYFVESYPRALDYTLRWLEHEDKVRFDIFTTEIKVINALLIAKFLPETRGLLKFRLRKLFNKIFKFVKWEAKINPLNYLHHYLFLKAAKARIKGNGKEALLDLDQAIENAKKGNFYLWIALGNELAAEIFLSQQQPRAATDYIKEAHYYYRRYGLNFKANLLENRFPKCFLRESEMDSTQTITTSASLDFMSVIKASQTISGEIILEKLFSKMLHIVIENAGAQKALFLELDAQGDWKVSAYMKTVQGKEAFKMLDVSLDQFPDVPQTVVQYVLRSEESVMMNNAAEDSKYRNDPYIVRTQPKSVLCIPILHQDRVIGIIYLENNLTIAAFTQERITVLTTLASQIAISLENARHFQVMENLYRSTERFVPKPFLSLLKKETIEQIKVGDSAEVNLAPMFADIRNFTTMSEAIGTEGTAYLLNSYMQTMAPIIRRNHGFVSQFFGDGIMALFPRRHSDAVDAAIQMRTALPEFNKMLQAKAYQPIQIGIGIHAGPAMLITLGEAERIDPSVVSDVVNSAARIEGLNKLYGTGLLFSETVYKALENPSQYSIRLVDKVKVKGKQQVMKIYEAMLLQANEEPYKLKHFINQYQSAFSLYETGNIKEALAGFRACLLDRPDDHASMLMVRRCEEFLVSSLPKDWDGTYTALEK